MTIIEAIKSGKRFRRTALCSAPGAWEYFCSLQGGGDQGLFFDSLNGIYFIDVEDILATDWEIEEETIEITRSNLTNAFKRCEGFTYSEVGQYEEMVARHLGFK